MRVEAHSLDNGAINSRYAKLTQQTFFRLKLKKVVVRLLHFLNQKTFASVNLYEMKTENLEFHVEKGDIYFQGNLLGALTRNSRTNE